MNTINYQTDTNINHETDSDSDPILGGRGHRGKIGRLSRDLRHELNVRLEDGEEAETILAWLNAEEEVQAMITGLFKGVPISAQNLSNWRRGGFQRWLKVQERMEFMYEWLEGSDELEVNESANELAGRLSKVLLAELALAVEEVLPTLTDPAERCDAITKYLGMVTRVRQQEFVAQRLVREAEEREKESYDAMYKKVNATLSQRRMVSMITGKPAEPLTVKDLKEAGFPICKDEQDWYQAKVDEINAVDAPTKRSLEPIAAAQPRRKRKPVKNDSIKANQGEADQQANGADGKNETDKAEGDLGQAKQSLEPNAAAQPRPTQMPGTGNLNDSIKVNQGKADHQTNGTDGTNETDKAEADFGQDRQDEQDLEAKAGENNSIPPSLGASADRQGY